MFIFDLQKISRCARNDIAKRGLLDVYDANDMNKDGWRSLKDRLRGKIVFVGIGNPLRGDDGLGPALIRRLSRLTSTSGYLFFDVGEVPENYLQKIVVESPDTVVLIDAVNFGAPPGTIKIVPPEEMGGESFSTHNMSLKLAMQYLQKESSADVFMLGVQPQTTDFGEGISPPVRKSLEKIIRIFGNMFQNSLP